MRISVTVFYCVILAVVCAIRGMQVFGKDSQVEFQM
jgi:hypothetical protein